MQKKLLIAAGIVLGLSACSSTTTLQSTQSGSSISGSVTRGAFEPHAVVVQLEGKMYRGEWRTGAPAAEQKTATAYPHQKHIGEVRSMLKADDGSTLDCRWKSHGESAEGVCASGGRDYPLILK